MSRIGKAPITLPAGVEMSAKGREITIAPAVERACQEMWERYAGHG